MRCLIKPEPRPGIEYREQVPEPTIKDDEVLIKVGAASFCGSDLQMYEWSPMAEAMKPKFPLIPGHEFAGTIADCGASVSGLRVGDKVSAEPHIYCGHCYACRTGNAHNCYNMRLIGFTWDGAFAEFVKVPANACIRLPDSMSFEVGAVLEPTGVAVHAIQRAGSVAGCSVIVSGCGPIGLLTIQLCNLFGATRVVAVEPNPFRRKLAESLGAITVDPLREDLRSACVRGGAGRGFDVAFEVSGAPDVMPEIFESLRREATFVTIGHPAQPALIDIARFINKQGVTLRGVFGRRVWDTWELLLSLVDSGRLDLNWIITHRLDLKEFKRGFELLRQNAAKVVLVMQPAGDRQ